MRWSLLVIPLLMGCMFDPAGIAPWGATDGSQTEARPTDAPPDVGETDLVPAPDLVPALDGDPPPWAHRKQIIVAAAMVTGSHTDFPLLVRITGDTDLAAGARNDGKDIVFRSLDGATQYTHEIERYDSANGDLDAWVKVPMLSDQANTSLHLYYGNPSPPSPPAAAGVWSNGYAGVWHLSGATVTDSGPASHSATVKGTANQTTGRIGDGRGFDTQPNSVIELGDPPLKSNAPFTLELWFKPTKSQPDWIGLATKGRATDLEWAGVWLKPDKLLTFGWSSQSTGGNLDSVTKPAAGAWHHVFAVFDGADARLYYNGLQDSNSPKNRTYSQIAGPLILGTDHFDNNPSFDGVIDEVRLSSVARSAGWIATQYANQSNPEAHVTVGSEEDL